MGILNITRGTIVPVLTAATGTGAGTQYFVKDSVPRFHGEPGTFVFGLYNVVGTFTTLTINLEFTPVLGAQAYWETVLSWNSLTQPMLVAQCSEAGFYRMNVTAFSGGTQFDVWATIGNSPAGQVSITGNITAVNPSVSSLNAAIPSSGTLVAGSDGTDLRALVTDTYGRLKTVSSTPLGADLVAFAFNQLEVNFSVAFSSAWITNSIVTTGTHTQANGQATYGTGTGAAGEGKGVSVQALEYRPGHTWYSLFTAVFGTPAASSYQRIGPYNSTDGFWIGYEGTTFGLTGFFAGAATQTAKASWNGDPLDGSAGSNFTSNGSPVAWNPQKGNIYRFQGSWFGFAPVELDILSPDGTWVTAHTFRNPNTLTSPYAATTNWNMTIDVANTGNTSNISMSTACWAMGTLDQNTIVSSTVTDQTLAQSVRAVLCGKGPSGYANVATDGANNLYVSVYNMPGIASPGTGVPGSILITGGLAATSLPAATTNADVVVPMTDKFGRSAVVLQGDRALTTPFTYQSTAASPATMIASGGAGVYTDITELVLTNESATATIVSITDGTLTYKFALAGNGGLTKTFATPLKASSTATAWQVSNSAAVNVDCVGVVINNK